MITPIYIPIRSSGPAPEPKCPHCHKELEGWSEPSNTTFLQGVIYTIVGLFITAQLFGLIGGGMEGMFEKCERPFTKRYHYLMPVYPYTCAAARWITNGDPIFQEKK